MNTKKGFTLIELMITVAIIGILAAIAIPQYKNLIAKSQEGSTKGNLGTLRSALSIYFGDNEQNYPGDDLTSLTLGNKYLQLISPALFPATQSSAGHQPLPTVNTTAIDDTGGYFYYNDSSLPNWGTIVANCLHSDVTGSVWSSD